MAIQSSAKHPHGFSIICCLLLIALLGLLTAGAVQVYQQKSESITAKNFNSITYHPIFTWLFFNSHTQNLGFNPFSTPIPSSSIDVTVPLFAPLSTLVKVSAQEINGSDSFVLQYHGSDAGDIFNCQGTPLMANQQTESFYYVNEQRDLVCINSQTDNPSTNTAYPLIKNVETMVIRLGEDLDNDGLVNRYIAANTKELSYDRVINLRVSLLLRTNETSDMIHNQIYNLDGEEKGPYPDLYVRKVLTTTIQLKKDKSQ